MINIKSILKAKKSIPWRYDYMVEQDMIISRVLVDLYKNKDIRSNLLFRGGTALNKLFLKPPARYSEDLDLVLIEQQPIGFLMDAIKESLSWLGKPRTTRDKYGFKVIYPFENIDGGKSKLKIETNCRENFHVKPIAEVPFSYSSDWFTGDTTILTYDLEELMATKLRAVYQRRKGRDLFDAWYVFSKGFANIADVAPIFHAYNETKITKKMFAQNMEGKQHNRDFRADIRTLLPLDTDYDLDTAFDFFMRKVIPHI